jgi:NCS1 family nucleobase:cation symporter-1
LGIVTSTIFQAFHASQGAELGLPQMIQSRAQFGYRGVVVPLLAILVSLIGYNVVATVILSEGLQTLWSLNRTGSAIGISLLAAILAAHQLVDHGKRKRRRHVAGPGLFSRSRCAQPETRAAVLRA